MGSKQVAALLLVLLVAVVAAQESDSSTYILSRARRSPPQYQSQYSPAVSSQSGAGRPYSLAAQQYTPGGYQPNRFDYPYHYGQQQHTGFQPGNRYYHYNNGNSFGTPSSLFPLSHQEVPGTLMWVPLDTLPFHIHLQQQLEFLKLHAAITQPPFIGSEDAVEIPGESLNLMRVYRAYGRRCIRKRVSHIWTKEGDIILPKTDVETERSPRNIPITFPSNLYRPPTVLREVRREPTVLKEIRRPASVTLEEVENEVESDGQQGEH